MTQKPRSWFRIHLSTAWVLLIAASGLVYGSIQYIKIIAYLYIDQEHGFDLTPYLLPIAMALCVALSMGVLGAVGFLSEALIRRRERKRQELQG